jgi:hypothetical protein
MPRSVVNIAMGSHRITFTVPPSDGRLTRLVLNPPEVRHVSGEILDGMVIYSGPREFLVALIYVAVDDGATAHELCMLICETR